MNSLYQVVVSIKKLLQRPIAFYPALAEVGGSVVAGIFLSQACYWSSTLPDDRDGWFFKTMEEWKEETYLTRAQQETARTAWRELGILEEERRGNPAKLWYRVDFSALQGHLGGIQQTRLLENRNLDGDKPAIKLAEKSQTIYTETTTEITAEKAPRAACPECGARQDLCYGHKKKKVKQWPERPRFERKEQSRVQEVPTRSKGEERAERTRKALEVLDHPERLPEHLRPTVPARGRR